MRQGSSAESHRATEDPADTPEPAERIREGIGDTRLMAIPDAAHPANIEQAGR